MSHSLVCLCDNCSMDRCEHDTSILAMGVNSERHRSTTIVQDWIDWAKKEQIDPVVREVLQEILQQIGDG